MITDTDKDKIKAATDLVAIIEDKVSLTKSGANYVGNCPFCDGRKKLSVSNKKGVWKCFKCDKAGDAITWCMEHDKLQYIDAIRYLAGRANVTLNGGDHKTNRGIKTSFRDSQLISSGIDNVSQRTMVHYGDMSKEIDRYEALTEINWQLTPGDDMVLHYVGLDRQLITYTNSKTRRKSQPFFRVRYSNPERDKKLDRDGNPVKYRSPAGGGNQLWLPEFIIRSHELGAQLGTLVVTEGEKKADKLCIEGMPAVGIPGIHNLSLRETMPLTFQHIIRRCGINHVVFMLDADCMDLSFKTENIDARPTTFASAVWKFYEYFDGYKKDGIDLRISLVWHTSKLHKGADDLLTYERDSDLIGDLRKSLIDVKHASSVWSVHRLNDFNSHRIKEIWHVNNIQDFLEYYRDKIIASGLSQVKIKGRYWSVTAEGIEEINKIRDWEQYWIKEEWEAKDGKKRTQYKYDYLQVNDFLKSHGFGRMDLDRNDVITSASVQKFVKVDGHLIRESTPVQIKDYVIDYTRDLNHIEHHEKKNILRMLYQASEQYFGENKLRNMYVLTEDMYDPRPDEQILIFKSKYWRITGAQVTEHPLEELPAKFWAEKQIQWDPELIPEALDISITDGKFHLQVSRIVRESDMWRYLWNTSNFHWRDEYEEIKDPETGLITYRKMIEQHSPDKIQDTIDNVVPKLIAMGYLTTDYINYANMKAIICMDNTETEVGKSKGGSGKSIFGNQFTHWKTVYRIDGKKKDLENDSFLYDGMDHTTDLIFFDDCRVNLDFETFFSQITAGITVNSKGQRRFNLSPRKMIFNTNHSLWGRDDSTRRRQYVLTFSDYYNINRTPYTEFGKQMFFEWEYDDYNLYFNIMAHAIQANLRYGLKHTIPGTDVLRRSLRQVIGEDLLDWAEFYFDDSAVLVESKMNTRVSLTLALLDFYESYPKQRNYVDKKRFREKLQSYCQYKGYIWNPNSNKDGRIRSNGQEYFYIGTHTEGDDTTQIENDKIKLPWATSTD